MFAGSPRAFRVEGGRFLRPFCREGTRLLVARFLLHFGGGLIRGLLYLLGGLFGSFRGGFAGVFGSPSGILASLFDIAASLLDVLSGGLGKSSRHGAQQQ